MTDPGVVKEELRRILTKMNQLRHQIAKIRVCTFEMSRKITDLVNVASEPIILILSIPILHYSATLVAEYQKKSGLLPVWGCCP